MGAKGGTVWGFKFNWGGNAGEYYLVRLREEGWDVKRTWGGRRRGVERRQDGGFPVIDDRDFVGFLKVVGV